MLPVIVPTVQVKVLGAEAVNAMLVAVALQIVAVFAVVTAGVGFTVTVIIYGAPWQAGVAAEGGCHLSGGHVSTSSASVFERSLCG